MQAHRQHGSARGPCTRLNRNVRLAAPAPHLAGRQYLVIQRRTVRAQNNGGRTANSFVTYYFDPLNPENVVEVVAKPAAAVTTPRPSSAALAQSSGSQLAKVDEGKMLAQLQLATQQLEQAKTTIQKLRQYELMYKESKMRAKQMGAELATLQALVADKDAELARQYKRMEKEAGERSGLRTQYTSALEEVRALRNDLEEARQAMLELKNAMPSSLARSKQQQTHKLSYVNGSAGYGTAVLEQESVLTGVAMSDGGHDNSSTLHGLQGLARQLAEGMEHEVGSFFGGRHH